MNQAVRNIVVLSGGGYNPVAALGSDLLAYWDANRIDTITQSGGLVSSWKDIIGGLDVAQGTGSAQPAYSASALNGAPSLSFDGIDDCLAMTGTAGLPIGATQAEIWAVARQDALPADASTRNILAYGAVATTGVRTISRTVLTSVNRARTLTGDGAVAQPATVTTVNLSSTHVLRSQIGATATILTVDGNGVASVNAAPATGNARLRIGASTGVAAAQFWQGQIAMVMMTAPLSAAKAEALQAYLLKRRSL